MIVAKLHPSSDGNSTTYLMVDQRSRKKSLPLLLINTLNKTKMSDISKIGFIIILVSTITTLVLTMVFNNSDYNECVIPALLVGIYMYFLNK